MKKGRNKDLIKLRNTAVLKRWYYWTEIKRLRFDDALKQLAYNEFFIAEKTIMDILRQHIKDLTDMESHPMPKVKVPRISAEQLELFIERKE